MEPGEDGSSGLPGAIACRSVLCLASLFVPYCVSLPHYFYVIFVFTNDINLVYFNFL